ncbi:hypothetical protein K7432_008085 [Basidiobolus ranarum]|uniref:Alcohol dehydrogenase-like N-terminal domain-containing protein n=1 Tax=Basidiobolus ranarum TaxID=34480 RepID=A0ABR2VZC7_9FUNG
MSMKCAVFNQPESDLEVVERPIPQPGPDEVLIKVEACGVCHSDCILKHSLMPGLSYPRVPGHEVVGRIQKLGENVCVLVWDGVAVIAEIVKHAVVDLSLIVINTGLPEYTKTEVTHNTWLQDKVLVVEFPKSLAQQKLLLCFAQELLSITP